MSSESGPAGRENDRSVERRSTDGGATEERPTYVHRPNGTERARSETTGEEAGGTEGAEPGGFGRAGWLLVVAVVLSTLVVPGLIYLFPAAPASLGLPFLATYLALPMVPAVLLGLVAVWTMTGAKRE
ncbi:hypothetical protein ACFO0N_06025 [Halobium salinum]|uniref:Cox cluster protein n=1 Tax=Halobium salinum TaxID=1364940 RepID=A0ABD5P9Y6_9EURY|nr:hypothetical protein [Halobium salinum]